MWKTIMATAGVVTRLMAAPFAWGEEGTERGSPDRRHRVVPHLNSGDEQSQNGALNNTEHLYQELGGDRMKVEQVAHGAGLKLCS